MFLSTIQSPAEAQQYGDWTVGGAQGYVEYRVQNGPGNEFNISCDEGASADHSTTGIIVTIEGKPAPANSVVNIILDAQETQHPTDEAGTITPSCNACYANLAQFWSHIHKAKSMLVQFGDGRHSSFSLKGAARAIPKKVCRTSSVN